MKLKDNFQKFQIRGAIKEIMRNYGLRSISLRNYYEYFNIKPSLKDIHSVKYDIMNGYVKVYQNRNDKNDKRCGEVLESITLDEYKEIFEVINNLINNI